jgi:hypothetical protein
MKHKISTKFIYLFLTAGFLFGGLAVYAGFPTIPQNVREQVQEKDLVEVVCLMSKWKTGEYFAALDSLQEILVPALTELKNLGISVEVPNISAKRAEADGKLNAICNAPTYESAESAAQDFANSAQGIKSAFGGLQTSLSSELKSKGEEMKTKVESGLKKWADEEGVKTKAGAEKVATELGNKLQSQLVAEMQKKGFKKAEEANAYAASRMSGIKKQIESAINSYNESRKAEIDANINKQASEILGFDVEKWQALGDKLNGIEGLISQSIAEKIKSYDKYRDQAFEKRKEMILLVVNKNFDVAVEKIKEQEEYLKAAKENDPAVKSAKEHLAELNADKEKLKDELLSMDLESEADFAGITEAVKEKWNGARERLEKDVAKKYSVKNICGEVHGQITAGKAQIDAGIRQIEKALAEIEANKTGCELSDKPVCEKIEVIFSELLAVKEKANNLFEKMTVIETKCASVSAETKWDKEFLAEVVGLKSSALDFKQEVNVLKQKWNKDRVELEKELAEKPTVKTICNAVNPKSIKDRAKAQVLDLETRLENCGKPCAGTTEVCSAQAATCAVYRVRKAKFNLADEVGVKLVAGLQLMEQKCADPAKQTLKDIVSVAKEIKTKAEEFDAARTAAIKN